MALIVTARDPTVEKIAGRAVMSSAAIAQSSRRHAQNRNASGPARPRIAREGYDPIYGARPLKRFLQRELETRLDRALVADYIPDGLMITIMLLHRTSRIQHQEA